MGGMRKLHGDELRNGFFFTPNISSMSNLMRTRLTEHGARLDNLRGRNSCGV